MESILRNLVILALIFAATFIFYSGATNSGIKRSDSSKMFIGVTLIAAVMAEIQ